MSKCRCDELEKRVERLENELRITKARLHEVYNRGKRLGPRANPYDLGEMHKIIERVKRNR